MAEGDHLTILNVYEAFIKVPCVVFVYILFVWYVAQLMTVDTTCWACDLDFDQDYETFFLFPAAPEELPVVP